jgi:hypothetical protein
MKVVIVQGLADGFQTSPFGRQKKAWHKPGYKGSSRGETCEAVLADAVVTNAVSAVSSQAVCTDVVGTVGSLTVVTYAVSAIGGQTVCTDVVGTVGSLAVVTNAVSAVGGQAVCTDVIGTVGSVAISTGVRSIGMRRTTFSDDTAVQYSVVIGNRQSERARCQDGKTKAKQNVRSFHDDCSIKVQ